ncbi:acyl-CoA reductase-like NAD-dependent aldehyde dehydrogenase [Spinactinospora alkalitolerans]|uniref:Acyl-CoA reductase-like NAD-dependent aldehyde dehydrogenase n=1 Tax=Spinactinospora alkalitolerans TaxID=687207 RepID=A0A852TWI9_9ACTN|nr:aldehyde dehydrogenase family protein [Spinactinospora alkalitolerans]NYE47222.1 acyl-CoA reductase-like NAD-dependent aldehyde dehydrogenase [Spinactinospora alkalitolerans]
MTFMLKSGTEWNTVYGHCRAAAPEAFGADRVHNFWGGRWRDDGEPRPAFSPVDGGEIAGPPMLTADAAEAAVRTAADRHREWRRVPEAERRARVRAALDAWAEHRDLLALLLVWEIGKPWRLACQDVDRAISGVEWYLEEIGPMLEGRSPLDGPVSNIASWNYPMSVLAHAMCVQVLAGNAAIAKTPTDGGLACLTLATALAAREGLPFTLISGSGRELSPALVRSSEVGCVSFVGGRDAGGQIATALADLGKRHILEQEGLNCWGVWEFGDWETFSGQVRKTFDYAKQRCTAYPRFVVQRSLFDRFLSAYLPAVAAVRFGNPLAVSEQGEELPELDFGPLINAAKAKDLGEQVSDAIAKGAVPLYSGDLDGGRFVAGQNTDAYMAPVALLEPPRPSPLFHAEPFGPVDSIVLVDTEAELLAAMNASNGALVGSVSCDDEATAARIAGSVRAFKVGVNKPRSRGDRAELFGGWGDSWRGAFVGGHLLVHAVTDGPADERLPGNFPDYTLRPESHA